MCKAFFILLLFLVISFSVMNVSFGQNLSTEGDDFWVGFMENWLQDPDNPIILEIYISANDSTRATIDMPLKRDSFQPIDTLVLPDQALKIQIPTFLAMTTDANPRNNGIHIATDKDVSVYAMNKRQYSADMAVILPTYTLGNEYIVVSHWEDGNRNNNDNSDSEFLIVAIEDNTSIEIIPSYNTKDGHPTGVPYRISMNAGETYQVKARGDLTGTKVNAVANTDSECKRFAVFAGNMYTKVGECDHPDGHDHLYAQMYPTYTWGKEYITVDFNTRSGGDHVKVIAADNDTEVFLNGVYVNTLQSGQFLFLKELEGVNFISSDKIISVAQFSRSQACDNSTGDPFIILINPNEQVLKKITFFAPTIATLRYYNLSIIARSSDVESVRLNGNDISSNFSYLPYDTSYSYAKISITSGNHTLISAEGIIAYVYGYGSNESFGYPTGAGLTNLNLNILVRDSDGEDIPADSICHDTEIWFKPDTEFEFARYEWDFGDGTHLVTEGPDSVAHNYRLPGKYIVELKALSGDEGCVSGTEQTSVKVIRVIYPKVNIIGPRSVCPNTTDVMYSVREKDLYHMNWYINGGTSGSNITNDTIYVDWGETNFEAWLKVLPWDDRGCYGDTILKPVKVKIQLDPEAPFGPDTLCSSNIQGVEYLTFYTNGSVYDWKIDFGGLETGQGSHLVTVDWDSWGTGKIWFEQLSVTDTVCSGISDTLSVYIQKNPEDYLEIETEKLRYGIGEKAIFSLATDSLYHLASWQFDSQKQIDSVGIHVNTEMVYNCPGTYEIYAVVFDTLGICEAMTDNALDIQVYGPELEIIQVSHEFDQPDELVIQWKMEEAEFYEKPVYMLRDEEVLDSMSYDQVVYTDTTANSDTLIYSYEIVTNLDCEERIYSGFHNNILLLADLAEDNNHAANLLWNPYVNWESGVDSYELHLSVDGGSYEMIGDLFSDQIEYIFTSEDLGFEHCFKVKANESQGNGAYSWSNIACVTFIPELYPYNIITPNGDGKNETFQIDNIEHYPNAVLTIVNRWGKKMYETRGYMNDWGGLHNGGLLPNGTYYYVLELNEPRADQEDINGMITILR